MQNRLKTEVIEFDAIELDPKFPITTPSIIERGEISPDLPHVHNCFEIGYCYKGNGIFTIEDKILPYSTGDVVVINHREVHQAVSSVGNLSVWGFFNVNPVQLLLKHIQPTEYPLETESLCGTGFNNIIKISENPGICAIVCEMIAELRDKPTGYRGVIRSFMLILLIKLHRLSNKSAPKKKPPLKRDQILRVSPAIKYMANHFSHPLNMDKLAQTCHLSPPHFRKIFREAIGMSPSAYLTTFRIKTALIMLENTNDKIIDISVACGYPTLSCFNRAFKQSMGVSPTIWRKNNSKN